MRAGLITKGWVLSILLGTALPVLADESYNIQIKNWSNRAQNAVLELTYVGVKNYLGKNCTSKTIPKQGEKITIQPSNNPHTISWYTFSDGAIRGKFGKCSNYGANLMFNVSFTDPKTSEVFKASLTINGTTLGERVVSFDQLKPISKNGYSISVAHNYQQGSKNVEIIFLLTD